MYDPRIVQPMRDELTRNGVQELRNASEVDQVLSQKSGTVLVIVNSVCGCAAGGARPGALKALKNTILPDKVVTVFAGQDKEATERARTYFKGYPPSSPAMALMKDGEVVYMMERHMIEGHSPDEIAGNLKQAFERFCAGDTAIPAVS